MLKTSMSLVITTTDLDISLPAVDVDASLANQIVAAVNAYVERITRRSWGETKTATEWHTSGRSVWLRRQDVITVASVKYGLPGQTQATLLTTEYYVTAIGRLNLYSPPPSNIRDYIEVQYTYGSTEIPDDLRLAAVGLAIGMYNWSKDGGRDITERRVGSLSVSYGGGRNSNGAHVSADQHRAVISSYAAPRV